MRMIAWILSLLVAATCVALAVPLVAYAWHLQESRLADGLALGLGLWTAGVAVPTILVGLRLEGRVSGAGTEFPLVAAILGAFFLLPDPVTSVAGALDTGAPIARFVLAVAAGGLALLAAGSALGCILDDRRKRRQAARPRLDPLLRVPPFQPTVDFYRPPHTTASTIRSHALVSATLDGINAIDLPADTALVTTPAPGAR